MADTAATVTPVATAPAASPEASGAEVVNSVAPETAAVVEDAQVDAIDAAAEAGEISNKEAKELKKKLKIKVDGVESEEDIDFNDEDGLRKMLQKSKAFDSRAQKLSQLESQLNNIAKMIEEDPEGFLEKVGKNVDEIAEKRLARKIEEMKKSPEQLEKEKLIKERDELKAESDKIKKEKEEAVNEKLRQEQAQTITADITNALKSATTDLPNDPLILYRIGQAMNLAMNNGRPDITATEVIPYVEQKYKAELNSVLSKLSPQKLEALIGKDILEAWRKERIAQVKPNVPSAKVQPTGKSAQTQEKSDAPKKTYKDFFKMI